MGGTGASGIEWPFQPLTWYLLRTTALAESAVARRMKRRLGGVPDDEAGDLVSARVATFVPIAHWTQRLNGRAVPRNRVVFPGYMFAGFTETPNWPDLVEVEGLHGVLTQDGAPYQVAEALVGTVAARCAFGFYNPHPEPEVQRGMRVVARTGQFRGIEGDVVRVYGAKGHAWHADVLMELYGSTPLRLRLDDLVSVSYSSHPRQRTTGS